MKGRSLRCSLALLLGVALAALPAAAQVSPAFYDYARPTLDWYQIETDHFRILFHADAEGRGSSRTGSGRIPRTTTAGARTRST